MMNRPKNPLSIQTAATLLLVTAVVAGIPCGGPLSAQAQEPAAGASTHSDSHASTNRLPSGAQAADTVAAGGASGESASAGERVSIGSRLKVRDNETVREAVAVFSSSQVDGTVTREMVTVFGNAELSGTVDREMVTVFGRSIMTGRVGREMVTVLGDAEVDGPVGRECVTVFGNLKLGPHAKVSRDCVAVFGSIERHPDAQLEHEPVEILPMFSGLGEWITDGLLKGRLIPPGSRLAWIVVLVHFLFYGLIALLLPRPVRSCAEQIQSRPLLSFGVGLLTLILLSPLYLVLAAIGVGVVLIPFIGLAETALVCLGKTATLEAFGFQLFRGLGRRSGGAPLVAYLIGFGLVTLLYMVPIVGLLVWLALRPVSLGAAVLACSTAMRRNGNGRAPVSPGIAMPPPLADVGQAPPSSTVQSEPEPETRAVPPPAEPPHLAVAVLPRAGFWIRLSATALDFVALCWILLLPTVDSFFLFFWLAYHIGMWSWKGTTIGGIVCNLKVVRLDGRDADVSVCFVRGLASLFSALPLLLGFFWAGWTSERQSWHDKIAGTVIVRVPKGIPLI